MRVLLVTHLFPPDGIMGVERYTKTLALALAQAGDSVSILARRPGGSAVETVRERLPEGIRLYRVCGARTDAGSFLAGRRELEQHFARILLEEAPEVVHVNHLLFHSPGSIEWVRRLGAPVVFSLHDFYLACPLLHLRKSSGELCSGPLGGRECGRTCFAAEGTQSELRWGLRLVYLRRLLRMASQVLCPSRYVASFFQEFGVEAQRLQVVPNGLWIESNPSAREEPPPAEGPHVLKLAFLGAVVAHKGLHIVVEALRLARLPAVRLLVLGPCPEPGYVSKLRQQALRIAGLEIDWHGPYETAELPRHLADLDAALIPSQCPETFSFTAREALSCGCPVILARLGALAEIVREGENGFTFTHNRPEELARLLARLKESDMLRRRLRAGARATSFLSLPEHAESVRAVYQRAVEDLEYSQPLSDGELKESTFLEQALVNQGFG
jgi:glycosyltransferase involved in cell wall biosynthesis